MGCALAQKELGYPTFDLLSRTDDNEGPVSISLLHESDGGAAPEGGPGSIAEAARRLRAFD